MKITMISLLLLSQAVFANTFKIDAGHSEVGFSVKHLMFSNVKGRFNKFEGSFNFDDKKKELKDIDVKIDTASIDTNEKDRDKHLRGDDFFNADKFPTIAFKSEKIENKKGKPAKVTGLLTIRDKTQKVTLDVDYKGLAPDMYGKERAFFSASGKINRKDFGVSWNKTMDKGGAVVSDDVMITIEGEAVKQ